MLPIIQEVHVERSTNEARPPSQFQKQVIIRLEQMNDAKSVDPWLSFIFFDHDVYRLTPSGDRYPSRDGNVEKLAETLK